MSSEPATKAPPPRYSTTRAAPVQVPGARAEEVVAHPDAPPPAAPASLPMQLLTNLLDVVYGGGYAPDKGVVGGSRPDAVQRTLALGARGASVVEGGTRWSVGTQAGRTAIGHTETTIRGDRDFAVAHSDGHSLGLTRDTADVARTRSSTVARNGAESGHVATQGVSLKNDGQLGARSQRMTTERQADGSERGHGAGATISAGPEGLIAGGALTGVTRDAKGTTTTSELSGNVDFFHNKVSGGYKRSTVDKDGTSLRSLGATGTVQSQTGLTSVEGSLSLSDKGRSASLSGGETVRASAPEKLADGRWVVRYTKVDKVGASTGLSKQGAPGTPSALGSVGVTGGVSYQGIEGGSRLFASEAQALDFQRHVEDELPRAAALETAAGALDIPVGENRMVGRVLGADAGASASVGPIGGSARVARATDKMTSVTRVSEHVVQATVCESESLGGTLGLNASVVAGADFGKKSRDAKETVVRFDLQDPRGRQAYERFLASGEAPARGPGVEPLRSATSTTDTDSERWNLLGGLATAGEQHRLTETVILDGAGKLEVKDGEQSIDFALPGLRHERDTHFAASERNDRERSYQLDTTVASSSGRHSHRALAAATDVNGGDAADAHRAGAARSSGRWTISTRVDEAAVEGFLAKVASGAPLRSSFRDGGSNVSELEGQYETLAEDLAAAPDAEARGKAMARFMADSGGAGLAVFRTMSGMKPEDAEYDLALPGDRNFVGPQFRADNDRLLASLEAMARDPAMAPGRIASAASTRILELERRRHEIRDMRRYTDLPDQVRAAQVRETERYLAAFTGLRDRAFAALEERAGAGAQTPEGEMVALQRDGIRTLDAEIAAAQGQARAKVGGARRAAWAHDGAHATMTQDSARATYDGLLDRADYATADQELHGAEASLLMTATQDRMIDAARLAYLESLDRPEVAWERGEQLVALLSLKQQRLAEAGRTGAHAAQLYDFVGRRHADDDGDSGRLTGMHRQMARGLE